jgi:hypothetical protein
MTILTIQAGNDTNILSDSATTNYGTLAEHFIGQATPRSGLYKWDVSGVPTAAIVSAVTLSLYVTTYSASATINLYRTYRNWVEAQATWNIFSTGNNWGTAGCENTTSDRTATSSGNATASGTGWLAFTISLTEFASLRASNYGWLAKMTSGTQVKVASFDYGTSGNRPKLEITYEMPGGGVCVYEV